MRLVCVKESSVWAQEDVPAGDDHNLNGDDQPEPFQEAFFAGLVVKQPHAKERADGTACKRQCQQDYPRYTGYASPSNQLIVAIGKKRGARDSQQPRLHPVKRRQVVMQQDHTCDSQPQRENQRSGHGTTTGTGDDNHCIPCSPPPSVSRTLAARACTVSELSIRLIMIILALLCSPWLDVQALQVMIRRTPSRATRRGAHRRLQDREVMPPAEMKWWSGRDVYKDEAPSRCRSKRELLGFPGHSSLVSLFQEGAVK